MKKLFSVAVVGAIAALFSIGCGGVGGPDRGSNYLAVTVEEAPLGGEALRQRKEDLQRAFGDLQALEITMESLIERDDSRGVGQLDDFIATYMGEHLDPLLRASWQSDHPEVAAVDVNLRFAKANLLVRMRYPRRVQRALDDIRDRYNDRESMLVEYPMGQQSTIAEALEILQNRKWNG